MKRFSLRLPDDLHAALQQSAQNEYRSLHNQILIILEDHIRQVEYQRLQAISEPVQDETRPDEGESGDLMIMDGDNYDDRTIIDICEDLLISKDRATRIFSRAYDKHKDAFGINEMTLIKRVEFWIKTNYELRRNEVLQSVESRDTRTQSVVLRHSL